MRTLFAAAVAVSLLAGNVATAHADNRDDRDRGRHYQRDHGRRDHDKRDHDKRHDYRGHDRRDDHDRHRGRDHRRDDRYDRYRDRDRAYYNWDRRDAYRAGYVRGRVDQRRFDRGRYIPPRGFHHHHHHWRHGDRLPSSYYSSRYVVHDYHAYHLSPPPYGHHWVRVNDDVLLAAVASGVVVSVVSGLFY